MCRSSMRVIWLLRMVADRHRMAASKARPIRMVANTSRLLVCGWGGRDEYVRRWSLRRRKYGVAGVAQGVSHGGSFAPDADELLNVCDAVQVVSVEHNVGALLAGVSFVCVISHIVPPDL